MCVRTMSFRALGHKPAALDLSSMVNFFVGHKVHEAVQEAIVEYDSEWVAEQDVDFPEPWHGMISGHADLWHPGIRACVEIKTVGAAAFDIACGIARDFRHKPKPPEGPKDNHLLQGAMNGLGLGAEWVVILYVSKEPVSVGKAARLDLSESDRVMAEWWIPMADVHEMAVRELDRLHDALPYITGSPFRVVPEVVDKGRVMEIKPGTSWHCDYCDYKGECIGENR